MVDISSLKARKIIPVRAEPQDLSASLSGRDKAAKKPFNGPEKKAVRWESANRSKGPSSSKRVRERKLEAFFPDSPPRRDEGDSLTQFDLFAGPTFMKSRETDWDSFTGRNSLDTTIETKTPPPILSVLDQSDTESHKVQPFFLQDSPFSPTQSPLVFDEVPMPPAEFDKPSSSSLLPSSPDGELAGISSERNGEDVPIKMEPQETAASSSGQDIPIAKERQNVPKPEEMPISWESASQSAEPNSSKQAYEKLVKLGPLSLDSPPRKEEGNSLSQFDPFSASFLKSEGKDWDSITRRDMPDQENQMEMPTMEASQIETETLLPILSVLDTIDQSYTESPTVQPFFFQDIVLSPTPPPSLLDQIPEPPPEFDTPFSSSLGGLPTSNTEMTDGSFSLINFDEQFQ